MKTKIHLVRHGTTRWNEKKLFQGWTDIELSEKGKREAKRAAHKLKDETLHAIYTSPLKRAFQTAQEIAQHHDLSLVEIESLKEGGFGIFEGLSWDEIANHKAFRAQRGCDRFTYRPPGGESLQDVYTRTSKTLDHIASRHPHETIVIVCHGLVLKTIAYHIGVISKENIENLHIANAEPMMIHYLHHEKRYDTSSFPVVFYERS